MTLNDALFPEQDGRNPSDASGWRSRVEATRRGFSIDAIDRLVASGRLTLAEIDLVIIPRKTISNRRQIGSLTREQSDRLARVVRVISAAEDTFGTVEKAGRWLRRPSATLGGEAPLNLLDTSEGSREVERLLGRIDHGLAA